MKEFDKFTMQKLNEIYKRYIEIKDMLCFEEVLADNNLTVNLTIELKKIEHISLLFQEYKKLQHELCSIKQNQELSIAENDLFVEEENNLILKIDKIIENINNSLIVKDKTIDNLIMQITAKDNSMMTQEFVNDLISAYTRYCNFNSIKFNCVKEGKTATLTLTGEGIKSIFYNENGIHEAVFANQNIQVQVMVYLKPEPINYTFNDDDLKIDIYRSNGAGGQNVNKVSTAIRVKHLKTGIVATCQDERSQFQNKQRAIENLKQKVNEYSAKELNNKLKCEKNSIKELLNKKVRVYNYMFNEVVDIKTKVNISLTDFRVGNLKSLFNSLQLIGG